MKVLKQALHELLGVTALLVVLFLAACVSKQIKPQPKPLTLPSEVIKSKIDSQQQKITACYQTFLDQKKDSLNAPNRDYSLDGYVYVQFEINASGMVESAEVVENSLSDERLSECVLNVFTPLSFPKPKGDLDASNLTVHHPIRFSYQEDFWTQCSSSKDCQLVSGYCGEKRAINKRFEKRFAQTFESLQNSEFCRRFPKKQKIVQRVSCRKQKCILIERPAKVTSEP